MTHIGANMIDRRKQLVVKGKTEGLTVDEGYELGSILSKEAFEDFLEGKLGPLALMIISGIIGLAVNTFLVRRAQV